MAGMLSESKDAGLEDLIKSFFIPLPVALLTFFIFNCLAKPWSWSFLQFFWCQHLNHSLHSWSGHRSVPPRWNGAKIRQFNDVPGKSRTSFAGGFGIISLFELHQLPRRRISHGNGILRFDRMLNKNKRKPIICALRALSSLCDHP